MAWTTTDKYWGEKLKIAQQETEQAQAENAQLKLMIAGKGGSPYEPYDPPKEDPKNPYVPAPGRGKDKLARNPSSRQIRDRLKPFTHGTGYNDVGGSLRGVPDLLRIQLLRDAMAGVPRYIRSGPPPNVINKAPHIDSLFIDRMLRDYRNKQGPQLPGFV